MTQSSILGLSEATFLAVTKLFYELSGIRLGLDKRYLVEGRLRRFCPNVNDSLDDVVQRMLKVRRASDMAALVDALVTNETHFFREAKHFHFLAELVAKHTGGPFRIWSAASSTGEEAYSLAMVLANRWPVGNGIGQKNEAGSQTNEANWSVLGTDISQTVVNRAIRGVYPMTRVGGFPPGYMERFALRGEGPSEGWLIMSKALRSRVQFETWNLNDNKPMPGSFECVFLRNMLIYFDDEARCRIVRNILPSLAPRGLLMTGHAESLTNLGLPLRTVAPAVYALA